MPRKILIVDDNEMTVTVLDLVLRKAGYEVQSAPNGEEGYRKTLEFMPNVILLDIMMPIMDGFTMNRLLKQNPDTEAIPVIVISARSGMASLFEENGEPHIDGYLVKPFNANVLLMKIEEVFGKGSA